MKITVYKKYGFCWGVERAIKLAKETLQKEHKAYILGEIIHNPFTNKELSKMGLSIVNSIEEVPNRSVFMFPSHGIEKENEKIAKKKHLKTVSLICPFVINIEKLALNYEKKGFHIVIYGDKNHTEVKSLISRLKNYTIIYETRDIKKVPENKKLLFISQSTQNKEKFYKLFTHLSKTIQWQELHGKFTICNVTFERQEWLLEHINEFDFFIIVGGFNSSNTKKLYEIVKQKKKKGLFIEEWNEKYWQEIKSYNNIGIISGTSTPKEKVDEVVNGIKGRVLENGSSISIYYA